MERIYKPCIIVAEVGGNHQGDFDIAIELIKSAKLCGAHYVKFQKRNPIKAIPKKWHNKPHPYPANAFGETYLQHREALEFTIEQHKELKEYCKEVGIGYSSSVWDEDSAREIISLDPDYIKVPSAMNSNYKLLDILFREYNKDVHISLGMQLDSEFKELLKYIEDKKERVVFYWTVSDYPVKFEELYLLEIEALFDFVDRVGYSGHHLGIAADLVAYTLQASWIERHFTLDRTWRGSDMAASLEPIGLQKLCRDLKAIYKALKYRKTEMTEGEKKNRNKLKIITKSS